MEGLKVWPFPHSTLHPFLLKIYILLWPCSLLKFPWLSIHTGIFWDTQYNLLGTRENICMIFCLSGFSFCFTALSNFFASEINQIMWRSQGCPIWEWRNPVSVCCVCKITTRSILGELFPWGGSLHAVLIMTLCLFVCLFVFTMWTNHL